MTSKIPIQTYPNFNTLLDSEASNCPNLLLNEQSISYRQSCDLALFPYQGSRPQSELSLQY